ncbi:MAG: sigma-54-dependent Fis family transcriptional regulator [Gammaproteobacteria bacterium]|nr:sigma-54-dependent Fis family transcriptional regulator [Gammaproteobacteria bacterium]
MSDNSSSLGKVLILDADKARASELCSRLRYLNYEPVIADESAATSDGIAVVLGDTEACANGRELLHGLLSSDPGLPCLCLQRDALPASMPLPGARWPLDLPLRKSQLTRLLKRAERYRGRERRHRITGESKCIREVRHLIEDVADFDTNVLITGQSGTGKELVARTIHDLSDRADKPFVPINCGAIPADLLESELFGHDKGAFTGAISARTGRFELAEGGTLFLDEIGDMSLAMQVKLLRVLQERTFERVGSNRTRQCDVRIIAATHVDLPEAVRAGTFREDLFYRLNVFPIEMPPLYKRLTDLPQLMTELLLQHRGDDAGKLRVSPAALCKLAHYSWPGNIRELSNLVERLAIVKPEGMIDVDDLPAKYRQAEGLSQDASNPVRDALQQSHANLKEHLQSLEHSLINQAMQATDGVVAKAAKLLNMQRTTLVEKIRKYQLH